MLTSVQLLGTPAVQHEGEWLELPIGLPSALLYYLAYKNTWVKREELAYLFWSDIPETNARKNLRNLIVRIKSLDYTQSLEVERSRICWNVETDVASFKEASHNNQFSKVISFYKGDLLQGFRLDDALEFENWLETERKQLKDTWRDAVFLRNILTCVGLRFMPVNSSITLTASLMLRGGFCSKYVLRVSV